MVRLLGEADAAVLRALRREALECSPLSFSETVEEHDRLSPEMFAARLRDGWPDNFVAGAFVEGVLVGMTGFFRGAGAKVRHRGRIWGVYVREEARGAGLGKALLQLVLDTARALDGLETVELTVGEQNDPAIALYLSCGFQQYGHKPRALKVGDIAVNEWMMRYEVPTEPRP